MSILNQFSWTSLAVLAEVFSVLSDRILRVEFIVNVMNKVRKINNFLHGLA